MSTKILRYMVVLYPETVASGFGLDDQGKLKGVVPIHEKLLGYNWFRLDTDYILMLAEHAVSTREILDADPNVLVLPHAVSQIPLASVGATKNRTAFSNALLNNINRVPRTRALTDQTMADLLDYLETENPMPTMAPIR